MDPETRSTDPSNPTTPSPAKTLAPLWHTITLIVVLLMASLAGAYSSHAAAKSGRLLTQYLVQMGWEWLILAFVVWGVRRNGTTLRELIGGRWEHFEDFLLDVAIGFGAWIGCYIMALLIVLSIGIQKNPAALHKAKSAVDFLYPHTNLESLVAVGVAMTAGFCEEIVFRGYLQRQLIAFSNKAWVGIVAGAALFGAAHGYQTWWQMVLICAIGLLLGVVAYLRKSVRPGMLSHTLLDTTSLLAGRFIKI